jgi:MFS family permease
MNKKVDEYRGIGSEGAEGGGSGIPPHRLKTFDSLKNPAFRLYYGIMACQWLSMNIQMVARSLLIYRISGSGAILGSLALANAIPMLLLSLFGGAIADRVQKKNILSVGLLGSAMVSLGIAAALTLGYLGPEHPDSWWLLVASAALQGIVMGFMMPARAAIVPEIVGPERLMNAISLNNLGMSTFQIMASALAGFLIDAFDFDAAYYIITGLYFIGAVGIVFLPRTRALPVGSGSALKDILEGVRYIRQETTIFLILLFTTFGTIFGQPHRLMMPMFTEDILKVGATGLGLLMTVSGIGALSGSLVLASLPNKKRGIILLLSGLIMGLALVSFSFSQWWYPSLVLMFFVGLGQTGQMTMGNALLQYHTDASYRGRVMSFHMMGMGLASLGTFFGGMLAEAVGVQWSIGGMAMALAFMSILMTTSTPHLRKLD